MSSEKTYPANWRIASDFDPKQHMLNLKDKDYLTVQHRLLWFVRDQRDFIARGLALMPYLIHSEIVELDAERGYAHFKTYVRDVLGNEATMYGSEEKKDFGDYAEKASTKSLGRALAMLGYGTQYAPEMDEGERVVDSPVERKPPSSAFASAPKPLRPAPQVITSDPVVVAIAPATTPTTDDEPATADQQERMRKYRDALDIRDKAIAVADNRLRYGAADARIHEYIARWQRERQLHPTATAQEAK